MLELTMSIKRLILIGGLVFALLYAITLALHPARAAQTYSPNTTFTVTNTNNAGVGSLRRAILDANANFGADTIDFNLSGCPCVISLTTGLPTITDTVTIVGPGTSQLAVDGNNSVRVFDIGAVPVTLSDLTVQHGNTSGQGAGIQSTGPLTLTSVDVLANTSVDDGGGVYVDSTVVITGGLLRNNQCTNSFCSGGGLFAAGALTLSDTNFISNTAQDYGGGAYAGGSVVMSRTRFERNQCSSRGCGLYTTGALTFIGGQFDRNQHTGRGSLICFGAGAYAGGSVTGIGGLFNRNECTGTSYGAGLHAGGTLTLNGGLFSQNQCDGFCNGVGAFAIGAVTLNGVRFEENQCPAGACYGGGLHTISTLTLTNTQFVSNTAKTQGGGAYVLGNTSMTGGRFERNQATTGSGGGLHVGGNLILNRTQFISNTARDGGGLNAVGALTLTEATFISNTSANNGGGVYAGGELAASETEFVGNQASDQGGGAYISGTLAVSASTFVANGAAEGGGLYHHFAHGTLVNTLFARNTATVSGTALFLGSPGGMQLQHVTIAAPTVVSGTAIYVTTGTVGITNTIVANHLIGLNNSGGIVIPKFNLFFGNGTNTQGPITGAANNVAGDPRFQNVVVDDYHLGAGSAAIDTGTNTGVTTDFDGESRPLGGGFDSGFDEYRPPLYLPLIMR